jgi:hypothetical protein
MSDLFLNRNISNKNYNNTEGGISNYNTNSIGKVDNVVILQIILVYVLVIIATFFYISMAANFDSTQNKWVFIIAIIVAIIITAVFLGFIQSNYSRTKLNTFGYSIGQFFKNLSNTQKVLLAIIFIVLTIIIYLILDKLTSQPSMGYIRVDGGNNKVYQISDPVTIIGYSTVNTTVFKKIWKGNWIDESADVATQNMGVIVPITLTGKYDKTIEKSLPDINQLPNEIPKTFTYSMWLKIKQNSFVDQAQQSSNRYKVILIRGDIGTSNQDYFNNKTPGIYLDTTINALKINMGNSVIEENSTNNFNEITVQEIPINKWFCLTVVVMNNTVDIYIDGLLLDTLILKNSTYSNEGPLYLKSLGGFDGHLVYLRYTNEALEPKKVYSHYLKEKVVIDDFVIKYETTTPAEMLERNERLLAQSRENCRENCSQNQN